MILAVSGYSDTGKTTLVTMLLEKAREEGIRTVTVKHVHAPSSIPAGKDTSRHLEAGAVASIAYSGEETTLYTRESLPPEETIDLLQRAFAPDLVILEGFKHSPYPKVVLGDADVDSPVILRGSTPNEILEAAINHILREIGVERTLKALPGLDCGKCGNEACRNLAERILDGDAEVDDCRNLPDAGVTIMVDGQRIPIGEFVGSIVGNTVSSMIRSLRGVGNPDEIVVRIQKKGD